MSSKQPNDTPGTQLFIRMFIRKLMHEGLLDPELVDESQHPVIVKRTRTTEKDIFSSLRILPGIDRSQDLEEDTPPPPKKPRVANTSQQQDEPDAELPSTSALDYDDLLDHEQETLARINELRSQGKWSSTRLPVCLDAPRVKTHWDFLLEEAKWMHTIFRHERTYKRTMAKKIGNAVLRWHAEKNKREPEFVREREAQKQCAQMSKMVREFWQKIVKLVEFGQKEREEAEKREELDRELSKLVADADQLGKTMHSVDENEASGDIIPNGTANGTAHEQKPSTAANMERFAEEARSFQPKGNTLETANPDIQTVSLLEGQLREYQIVGLNWLFALNERNMNGILADEMGLGKTIQTIALFAHLADKRHVWGPHLIVVPTSVILNWEMEIKKWCPKFKVLAYYGSTKERALKRKGWTKQGAFDICITSYKLFVQDATSFKKKQWQYLVVDEAQHIKNFESQRWQALINLRTRRRILLTGTPLQNNLMELWSLLHFLMPNVFSSRDDFKDWFHKPISKLVEEGSDDFNSAVVQRLHKVLRPFILRRLKAEVEKQLPQKVEKVILCDLSKRQRYLYNEFMSLRSTVESLRTGSVVSVLNIVMQLRKCCNHPNLFEPRTVQTPFCIDEAPFVPFCRQFLVNKDNEFEQAVLRLPSIVDNYVEKYLPFERFERVKRNTGRISKLLRQGLFERVVDEVNAFKEEWIVESLKKYGIYVAPVLYSPIKHVFNDAATSWYDLYTEQRPFAHLRQIHRDRTEIDERALVSSVMQFPEVRLIEYDCGKLQMLAVMLRRLYAQNHRCLIFTQMSKMLDILQAFLSHHGYTYFRLDGSTTIERRASLMERFNSDPKIFCFILSTRAGGVGVNLTGADTVIFYDSDWNPTMDAQAQDRCHRIGQTKDVTIYRLISRNTIEENILKKAREKRRLGELAIDEAGFTPAFFKKTDNIRDLFVGSVDEETNRTILATLESLHVDVDDDDTVKKAMENAEDAQDVEAAKNLNAEIVEEYQEFSQQSPLTSFANASEEFTQLIDRLLPVQRYAVALMANEMEED